MNRQQTMTTFIVLLGMLFSPLANSHGSGMGMMGNMDNDEYREHMMQRGGMMGGPGMMGGMGMMGGSGMMGGMGMMGGPGMMGGSGMMGGMGMGPVMMLDLNDKQRDEILNIQRDMQKQNWERMGDMMNLRNQLFDIMRSDNPDPDAAGKVFDKMSALRKQMFMDQIKTRNQVMKKLSKEQREKLNQYGGPGMMMQ